MELAPIVVTRLAVRNRGATEPPSEEWVRGRVALLRRLGLPALQRAGDGVAWVLITDRERRDLVADLVSDLELPGGAVHLATGEGFDTRTAELQVDAVHPGRDRFATFRMDSDDALLPGSIAAVLHAAEGASDGTLVDLPNGFQLDLERWQLIQVAYPRWRQGPFLALVHHERSTMLDTGGRHTGARAGRPLRTAPEAAWIQGLHPGNVRNDRSDHRVAGRLLRSVRAMPSRGARAAWRDGRVVRPQQGEAILAAAGIQPRP